MTDLIPKYAIQYTHPQTGKTLTLGEFDRAFGAVDLLRTVEDGWIAERHVTKYERLNRGNG